MPEWTEQIRQRLAGSDLEAVREAEIVEELAQHLEDRAEELRAQGATVQEARIATLAELGDSELFAPELRRVERSVPQEPVVLGVRRRNMMADLGQDLRYAVRMLRKNPSFTFVAVLTLALGIGATTAIFSVVNAVLLRPLPYPDADRLVQVWQTNPLANRWGEWVSYPDFVDWREQNTVFEEIGAYRSWRFNITGSGQPEAIAGTYVSASLLSALGATPLLGRSFLEEEDQPAADRVVILSHRLWQRLFASDPSLLGREIFIDRQSHIVVGVMRADFMFPSSLEPELWIPHGPPWELKNRGSHNSRVVALLRRGVTLDQAQANMDSIALSLAEQNPGNREMGIKVMGLQTTMTKDARPALLILAGAIGLVLLIACTNVANLLLARSAGRRREIAIRQAIGASRSRLVRQLLTESILLGLLGGGVGLLLAFWGVRSLIKLSPNIPRLDQTSIDLRVLSATLLLSLVTAVLFGILPALRITRSELNEALKPGGKITSWRDGARIRNSLVIAETALALMLLVGAGLLIRSFLHVQKVDPGFDPDHCLSATVMLPQTRYPESRQQSMFFKGLVDRIGALPGVDAVGGSTNLPFRSNDSGPFLVEGAQEVPSYQPGTFVEHPKITPDYFRATGIRLLRGRSFTWADDETSPEVAIVNEGMARHYWPDEDPIGKRVSIDDRGGRPVWRQIVGIVNDVKHDGLEKEIRPHVFVPMLQFPQPFLILAVRVRGVPEAFAVSIRDEVAAMDRDQPVFAIQTMERLMADSVATRRFQMTLLSIFAAAALVLATVGIYGVMAYVVAQRTPEIGVRIALGATTSDILRLVIGHGMTLTLAGLLIGLIGAFALTRVISGLLFQVGALDLTTFAAVAFVMGAVGLVACSRPASRASKVDPMTALRSE